MSDKDEWGNIELPGLSDDILLSPKLNVKLANKSKNKTDKMRNATIQENKKRAGESHPSFGKPSSFVNCKHTEITKKKLSENHTGELNPMHGKNHSEDAKKKISQAQQGEKSVWYGKTHTESTRKKISMSAKGKIFTDEHRKKLSDSKKGKPAYNKGVNRTLVQCPHCGKEGGEGIMHRWHFDNCKHK